MGDGALEKSELRARMKGVLRAVGEGERAGWSGAICERVAGLGEFGEAAVVCLFAPMIGEVDVWPLAHRAKALGKRVAVPREWGGGRVELAEVPWLEGDLVESGRIRGVRVPRAGLRVVDVSEIGLIVTPGLAFDGVRRRLGRGGGVYDALVSAARRAGHRCAAVGVAFEAQVVAEVPVEEHDERVDVVVTEARVIR